MSRTLLATGHRAPGGKMEVQPVGGRALAGGDRLSPPLAPDAASQLVRTMWTHQGKFVTADADGVRVAGEATS